MFHRAGMRRLGEERFGVGTWWWGFVAGRV